MSELDETLNQLTMAQHLLALVFLLGYGTALSSMFGPKVRLRALLMALLAAAGFASLTQPWEYGVLLVSCAIGAIGMFIAVVWVFSAISLPVESATTASGLTQLDCNAARHAGSAGKRLTAPVRSSPRSG